MVFLMNTLASLFNLAGPDMVIILLIVLLLFGAKKLPELARGMGQAMREFNKAKDDFEREVVKPATEVTVQPAANTQALTPGQTTPVATPTTVAAPAAPVTAAEPVAPVASTPKLS
jgi:sec-independent protein translocase protein TatA